MESYCFPKLLVSLVLLLSFGTSCNGQSKAAPDKKATVNKSVLNTKLVRTQGTNSYASVCCALQDRNGTMWFGTGGEGVYRYDGKVFINFTEKDGLGSNTVHAILEDRNGNIWLATNAGLCKYNASAGINIGEKKFTCIPMSAINGSNVYSFASKPGARPSTGIWSMLEDKKGNIWLGTGEEGVYRYDGKQFTHFLHNDTVENKAGLKLIAVNSIIEDRHGNIWFTTWFEGICKYDGKAIVNYKPNGEVWYATLLEDKAGNIWAGRRDKGVCRYDGKNFTNVLQHGAFDSCGVDAIVEDTEGNMWFATEAGEMIDRETMGGMWRYNPKEGTQSFTNFTMKDGLTNYSVFCALQDKAGHIWAGTRDIGLCRFDGKRFVSFSE